MQAELASVFDMAEFYLYRPPEYVLDYIFGEKEKNVIVQFIDGTTSSYAVAGALERETVQNWPKSPKSVIIRNSISGEGTTSIGASAFIDQHYLTSIIAESSVSAVGLSAFANCENLKSISIAGSLKKIENGTCLNCSSLHAFSAQGQWSSIGYDAFNGCSSLPDSISFPDSVVFIGDRAFKGCTSLRSGFSIPASLSAIEQNVFSDCTGLTAIPDLPESVKYLKSGSFNNCTGIKNLVVPNTIDYIEAGVFSGCSSITAVTLPFIGRQRGNYDVSAAMFASIFGFDISPNDTVNGWYHVTQHYSYEWTDSVAAQFVLPSSLTDVKITDETIVGFGAFSDCRMLTSINIPSTVSVCNGSSFNGCSNLANLVLPFVGRVKGRGDLTDPKNRLFGHVFGPVEYDKSYALKQYYDAGYSYTYYIPKSLTTVRITDDTYLGGNAFQSLTSLVNIQLPSTSLTAIDEYAFYGCTSLSSITIPDSVSSINVYALSACSSLKIVSMSKNVNTIETGTFADCTALTSFTHPSIEQVGPRAFANCRSLRSWQGGSAVKTIYQQSFISCTALTSVNFGNALSAIGDYAFSHCTSLQSCSLPNSLASIGARAFEYDTVLQTATIGGSSLAVGENAFRGCSGLKTLSWRTGCSLTSIGNLAFAECTALTSTITFPVQLRYIGDRAFYGCSSIKTVNAGNCTSLTSVGEYAFYNCASMTGVNMPESSLKDVKRYTYSNCTSLRAFSGNAQISAIGEYAFYNTPALASGSNWHVVPSVRSIGAYAFSKSGLQGLVISAGIQTIGSNAFEDCPNLTGVTLPNTVTSVGQRAFCSCKKLKSASFGSGITTIQKETFLSCAALTNFTSSKVQTIGDGAFSYCDLRGNSAGLVEFPDTLTTIGQYAFYSNKHMVRFLSYNNEEAAPSGLKTIGAHAFDSCTALQYFTFAFYPASTITIGDYAFQYCSALNHVGWSGHLFEGRVMLPDQVVSIGQRAFDHCTGLDLAVFGPGSSPSLTIGAMAYANCPALVELIIANRSREQIAGMPNHPWGISPPQKIHGNNY